MTLYDLIQYVNDSTFVILYSASTGEVIEKYDGKDSLSGDYDDYEVTDIFVSENGLCIEIDDEEGD